MPELKKLVIVNEDGSTDARKEIKVRNNYYALAPLLIFENCFGIFRFYLKNNKLNSPNWAMKLYSAVLITIYLTVYGYFLIPTAITGKDGLIDIIDEIPSIVILFQYATTMLSTSFFLSKSNMEIISTFAEIDEQHIKTTDEFYKKHRKENIKYLLLLCLSQAFLFVIDFATGDYLNMEFAIAFPVYFVQKLEILGFCVFIGLVQCRLKIINGYLTKFLEDKDSNKTMVFTLCDKTVALNEINLIGRPSESNMKIRDLAMLYDKLGIICSLINDVYNFQIFMSLVSTFVYIVITIWTSLYYYKSPEGNSGPLVTVSIWCFTTILVVAVMCFVCERLRLVRNTTKTLVNQIIMDYDLPKTMRVQAKAFMELIEAWPLRIFVYDMFTVDITLMLKFISVATTYLIVIIQISHFTN